jgi:uncharacterized protein
MRGSFHVIDADRHVTEPLEMWREYLEPEYQGGAPYSELRVTAESLQERVVRLGAKALVPPLPTVMLDGEPVWNRVTERAMVEMAWAVQRRPGSLGVAARPEAHLEALERSGVDMAFLYPTSGLFLLRIDSMEPARAAAFARAYNTWLRDYCSLAPERLRGVGALSLHDPALALAELERVVGFGFKAVVLPPNPVRGRLLSDPAYEPLWEACERHSLAVALHEGTHVRLPSAGADRFHTRFALNACSHPLEQMMGLLALIEGGVLERHPGLRVALLEAGCGWVPYWLWRLDEVAWRFMGGEVAEHVRRPPSEYFRRQCFVSIEPGEPYLAELLRFIGPDCLLFGSDFPHLDHGGDELEQLMALRSRLPEEVLRKLLWDNPARLYGLEGRQAPG